MKILNVIKVIVVNILVFAILLIAVNWMCGVYLKRSSKSNRSELPNYSEDHEYAQAVFSDYNSVQHRYEPFVGWRALPYNGRTTHVSQQGLRGESPEAHINDTRKVVRFFGGSTMWGEGSDDEHTIPALFNKLNPDYRVYNHGQLAYNTRQELDELISVYARNEETDVVIFYDGVNDAAFLCPQDITELPAHRLVPMYRDKLYRSRIALAKELVSALFVEDIMALVQKATYQPTPDNSPYDCVRNPEKAEDIAEMMIKNWELAHEIVTRRKGTFYAVLQPAAFIGKPRTDHLSLDAELGKNFQKIYELLQKKIAERNHPWIIDLSHAFDGGEYIFIDFCHVSPNGNEIIAREISAMLSRNLQL